MEKTRLVFTGIARTELCGGPSFHRDSKEADRNCILVFTGIARMRFSVRPSFHRDSKVVLGIDA